MLPRMQKTVRDVMNPKLLYIRDGDRPSLARRHILSFGITAVPVLDDTHRPVSIVSLRDLDREGDDVVPSGPVVTVRDSDTIEDAAKKLAESDFHHFVVVDDKGVAVGMVSSVDFLRALLGMESRHPRSFDKF
jgi:CBS-domain-containing membrane protein